MKDIEFNGTDEQLLKLATRFYERRLDEAKQIRLKFAAHCKPAPGWTFDFDMMQAQAWDEARRFIKTGEGHGKG